MKFISFGIIAFGSSFAINLYGQETFKEQLKNIEVAVASIKKDSLSYTFEQLKSENNFDKIAIEAFQSLDSLPVLVNSKRLDVTTTFEDAIIPFLDIKCNELDLKNLSYTENESLIYESFVQVLEWDKTIETVKLYEAFVLKGGNKIDDYESLLTVLSFIKCTYFYIQNWEKLHPKSLIYKCIAENFENSNEVDWNVFSFNPGRLIFWTMAACVWDTKTEK